MFFVATQSEYSAEFYPVWSRVPSASIYRPLRLCAAIIDLQSGDVCDEINELRYCARSLVCLRCPDDNVYKCVRCTYDDNNNNDNNNNNNMNINV